MVSARGFDQRVVNPFWVRVQKNDNRKKITKWVLRALKITVYLFLMVIGLWGCFQIYFDHTISAPTTIGAGLEICYNYGSHDYVFDCVSSQGSGNYAYYTFDDWSLNYGPFYAFFVWPFSKIVIAVMWATRSLNYGFNTLIAIILVLLIIRIVTLAVSIRSILATERMSEVSGKLAEIKAKYKGLTDMASKQRQQLENQQVYRRNNIKPFAAFEQMFITLPIALVVYRLVTLTRPIKATILFNTWDLSQQPFGQIFNNFTSGGWVYIFLLLIIMPLQILQTFVPILLSRRRNRNARTTTTAGAQQSRKTQTTQWIVALVSVVFTAMVASGVGVYYFFSAIFTISQSALIHHIVVTRRRRQKTRIEDIGIFK